VTAEAKVLWFSLGPDSNVKDSSVVAVQVFDQRKFKRKDQGFLGVINIKVADVIDLDSGGQGESEGSSWIRWSQQNEKRLMMLVTPM
jgi:hypothetical protein